MQKHTHSVQLSLVQHSVMFLTLAMLYCSHLTSQWRGVDAGHVLHVSHRTHLVPRNRHAVVAVGSGANQ